MACSNCGAKTRRPASGRGKATATEKRPATPGKRPTTPGNRAATASSRPKTTSDRPKTAGSRPITTTSRPVDGSIPAGRKSTGKQAGKRTSVDIRTQTEISGCDAAKYSDFCMPAVVGLQRPATTDGNRPAPPGRRYWGRRPATAGGKVGPMVALPGPHYRNNPHPKPDFLLWRAPRSPWPMKEAPKPAKKETKEELGATATLKKEEKAAMAKIIKEAQSNGVFHQGAVFSSSNANRGRHWSIHPEWPIKG